MQRLGYSFRVRKRGGLDRWTWEIVSDPRGQRVLDLKGETVGLRFQAVTEAEQHIDLLIQRRRQEAQRLAATLD